MSSQNVVVAVRSKPMPQEDVEDGCQTVVRMHGNSVVVTNPISLHDDPKLADARAFTFDHTFWSTDPQDAHFASQQTVFEALGSVVLDNAWAGYNCSVFAYGQTGSGKSHTMFGEGSDEQAGLIPRVCRGLLRRVGEAAPDVTEEQTDSSIVFMVQVNYMEIYNEQVKDLLISDDDRQHGHSSLRVRENPKTGPYVEGLTSYTVTSYSEIESLIRAGNLLRSVASTNMNATSSRSHSIFSVTFTQTTIQRDISNAVDRTSKLHLVDLAGSERASKTGAQGSRLREAANINRSLSALGNVINLLAEGKGGTRHIPYRNSVLTWLLKESLGGNAKSIMLATISPSQLQYDETMSTLRYAESAKRIVNDARVNEDPNVLLIKELRQQVAKLQAQLAAGIVQEVPSEALHDVAILRLQNVVRNRMLKAMRLKIQELRNASGRRSSFTIACSPGTDQPQLVDTRQVVSIVPLLVDHDSLLSPESSPLWFVPSGTSSIGSAGDIVVYGQEGYEVDPQHCWLDCHATSGEVFLTTEADCIVDINGVRVLPKVPVQLLPGCHIVIAEVCSLSFHILNEQFGRVFSTVTKTMPMAELSDEASSDTVSDNDEEDISNDDLVPDLQQGNHPVGHTNIDDGEENEVDKAAFGGEEEEEEQEDAETIEVQDQPQECALELCGWVEDLDEESGYPYYYHTETMETSWTLPEGAELAVPTPAPAPAPAAAAAAPPVVVIPPQAHAPSIAAKLIEETAKHNVEAEAQDITAPLGQSKSPRLRQRRTSMLPSSPGHGQLPLPSQQPTAGDGPKAPSPLAASHSPKTAGGTPIITPKSPGPPKSPHPVQQSPAQIPQLDEPPPPPNDTPLSGGIATPVRKAPLTADTVSGPEWERKVDQAGLPYMYHANSMRVLYFPSPGTPDNVKRPKDTGVVNAGTVIALSSLRDTLDADTGVIGGSSTKDLENLRRELHTMLSTNDEQPTVTSAAHRSNMFNRTTTPFNTLSSRSRKRKLSQSVQLNSILVTQATAISAQHAEIQALRKEKEAEMAQIADLETQVQAERVLRTELESSFKLAATEKVAIRARYEEQLVDAQEVQKAMRAELAEKDSELEHLRETLELLQEQAELASTQASNAFKAQHAAVLAAEGAATATQQAEASARTAVSNTRLAVAAHLGRLMTQCHRTMHRSRLAEAWHSWVDLTLENQVRASRHATAATRAMRILVRHVCNHQRSSFVRWKAVVASETARYCGHVAAGVSRLSGLVRLHYSSRVYGYFTRWVSITSELRIQRSYDRNAIVLNRQVRAFSLQSIASVWARRRQLSQRKAFNSWILLLRQRRALETTLTRRYSALLRQALLTWESVGTTTHTRLQAFRRVLRGNQLKLCGFGFNLWRQSIRNTLFRRAAVYMLSQFAHRPQLLKLSSAFHVWRHTTEERSRTASLAMPFDHSRRLGLRSIIFTLQMAVQRQLARALRTWTTAAFERRRDEVCGVAFVGSVFGRWKRNVMAKKALRYQQGLAIVDLVTLGGRRLERYKKLSWTRWKLQTSVGKQQRRFLWQVVGKKLQNAFQQWVKAVQLVRVRVSVSLLGASNLACRPYANESLNPYALINLSPLSDISDHREHISKTKWRTNNPEFNQRFEFTPMWSPVTNVELRIMHSAKTMGRDEVIGTATAPIGDLEAGSETQMDLALGVPSSTPRHYSSALSRSNNMKVRIAVMLSRLPPSTTASRGGGGRRYSMLGGRSSSSSS